MTKEEIEKATEEYYNLDEKTVGGGWLICSCGKSINAPGCGDCQRRGWKYGFIAGASFASPQWISVEERLPEENQSIIGLTIYPQHIIVKFIERHFYSNEWGRIDDVIYWMPLPEAPTK